MVSNPEITGVAGLDGESGAGIARAVIESKKEGKVKIVCFDRNDDLLDYVANGTVYASVAQKSYLMCWLGLTLLDGVSRDQIRHLPDWRKAKALPIPLSIDTGVMVINSQNVDQFRHQSVSTR